MKLQKKILRRLRYIQAAQSEAERSSNRLKIILEKPFDIFALSDEQEDMLWVVMNPFKRRNSDC